MFRILLVFIIIMQISGCEKKEKLDFNDLASKAEAFYLYDVNPKRNPDVIDFDTKRLAVFTKAEFNLKVFKSASSDFRLIKSSFNKALSMGGNLGVLKLSGNSELRFYVGYNGFITTLDTKDYYSLEDSVLIKSWKNEHKRIVEDIFIPKREN